MKTEFTDLIHKINNQFGLVISSVEAMDKNINDADYCKAVTSEILNKKNDFTKTIMEIKLFLSEKASELS